MTPRLRALGLVPLAGVAWAAADYARAGQLPMLACACNPGALAVALGVLFAWPRAAFAGTLLLVATFPGWIGWVVLVGDQGWHAILTHVAAPAIGLFALRRLERPRAVVATVLVGLGVLGLIGRWLPPELDVNLASRPVGVQLAVLALVALALVAVERAVAAPRGALGLTDRERRAFFDHLRRASRRGPGEKRALRELVDRVDA